MSELCPHCGLLLEYDDGAMRCPNGDYSEEPADLQELTTE